MPEPIGINYSIWRDVAPRAVGQTVTVWENNNGWLLCDGRLLSSDPRGGFADLFNAIGFTWGMTKNKQHFNIPDLQGYFLRGVDLSRDQPIDRDRDLRFSRHDGNKGGRVGSFQLYATALPLPGPFGTNTAFRTNPAGEHTHNLFFQLNATRDVADEESDTVVYPGGPETDAPMRASGKHIHNVTEGGNLETRPR
jgi:hypothetical protein